MKGKRRLLPIIFHIIPSGGWNLPFSFTGFKYCCHFQVLSIFMQGLIISRRRDAELQGSFDYLCNNKSDKSRQIEKQGVVDIYVHYANCSRLALVIPIWMICVPLPVSTIKKKNPAVTWFLKSLGSNEG